MCIPHVLTKLSGKTDFILEPGYVKKLNATKMVENGIENKNADAYSNFGYLIVAWKDHFFFRVLFFMC